MGGLVLYLPLLVVVAFACSQLGKGKGGKRLRMESVPQQDGAPVR